jgi:hypothetical protein
MEYSLLGGTAIFLILLAIAGVLTRWQQRDWVRQLRSR